MKKTNGSYHDKFYWRIAGVVGITLLSILLILLAGFTFKVLLFILSGISVACFFRGIAKWIHKKTGLLMNWLLALGVVEF